jgi:inosine-uridine nucleoside N-ribohydrolase
VTIIALGRLTNLALALREAPEIAGMVGEVILMGGAFGYAGSHGNVSPAAEANIAGDPLAADEVFGAAWRVAAIGLDVTERVEMPQDYLQSLARDAGEAGQFIWDVTRFYEASYRRANLPGIYAHDASAVAYAANPGLFKTRSGPIRVVRDGLAVGETIQKPGDRPFPPGPWDKRPAQSICIEVDADGVRTLFRQALMGTLKG